MAIVSWKHRFLFVQTPRTGCTAIAEKVLVPLYDGEDLPPDYVYDGRGMMVVDRKHSTLQQLLTHGFLSNEQASSLFKFSAVRNPFDSQASEYVKQRFTYRPLLDDPRAWIHRAPGYVDDMRFAAEHTFEEWLERRWRRPFLRAMVRGRYRVAVGDCSWQDGMDFVMRFERLQEDFDEALRRIGLPQTAIPAHNVTRERESDYRGYYTPRARRVVEAAFAETIERFRYTF